MPDAADNPNKARFQAKVTIGSGITLQQTEIYDLVITAELDQPDSCAITLTQSGAKAHGTKLVVTDPFKVKLGHENDDHDFAFAGELAGIEPIFANSGKSGGHVIVRGLNSMHALARGKRSCAYTKGDDGVTDKDIIDQVLQRNSALQLSADYGKEEPKIRYQHVYQHNQTDLEFLRHRASRLGYFMLVRDKKLLFQKRTVTPSGLSMVLNTARKTGEDASKELALERFVPRISTASQVTQVKVRCFNPETRKPLICVAPLDSGLVPRPLAADDGESAIEKKHPDSIVQRYDIPFGSVDEGNAIAASLLDERRLSYVTADGTVPGDARIKPGIVVQLSTGDSRCDGTYFVTHVRHSYKTVGSRFLTDFRAKRDATNDAS